MNASRTTHVKLLLSCPSGGNPSIDMDLAPGADRGQVAEYWRHTVETRLGEPVMFIGWQEQRVPLRLVPPASGGSSR